MDSPLRPKKTKEGCLVDEADMVERVRTILTRSAEQWPRWQTGLRSLNQVHFLTGVLASISMVVFPEEDEDDIDEPDLDLSGCLYYRHFNYHEPLPEGFRCSSCWTEPACVTSEPEGGWPGDPTKGAAEAAPTFDLAAGQPARCGCLLRRRCRLGVVDVLAGDLLRGLAALGLCLFRHGGILPPCVDSFDTNRTRACLAWEYAMLPLATPNMQGVCTWTH